MNNYTILWISQKDIMKIILIGTKIGKFGAIFNKNNLAHILKKVMFLDFGQEVATY